jgi:pre-mRNA-processing factor 40
MDDMVAKAKITPTSRWQDILPLIKDNYAYQQMLGQPGSTPLQLFWDVVEDLYQVVYERRKKIEAYFKVSCFMTC